MTEITALFIAAGLGMRMGPRGRMTPKGLIEMGGEKLVPKSVETLRRWGVDRVVVVTGHLHEQYAETFAGTDVTLIHNADYDQSGSLRTLLTGLDHVDGHVMLVESDLIYAPQVVEGFLRDQNCFLVSGPTGAGDEVYTWVHPDRNGDLLFDVSKDRAAHDAQPVGEQIGISGLTGETLPLMRQVAEEMLATTPGAHYEDALAELGRRTDVPVVLMPDAIWAEVDDEEMLARAKAEVLPKVEAARRAAWGHL